MHVRPGHLAAVVVALALAGGCGTRASSPGPTGAPPMRAPTGYVIDRFSAAAGHLMVRGPGNHLPGPDQPIDLDQPPFITQAFGPEGAVVRYYNFDVAPAAPAPRYRLTHAGAHVAIAGQLDLVDAIPGDPGYSDFWQVTWVEVPADFTPGSIASTAELQAHHWPTSPDAHILDCPVVPAGTSPPHGPTIPTQLAYRGAHVTCLEFGEPLAIDGTRVPTSPIYVTFAPAGGGFRTEPNAAPNAHAAERALAQTHNVVFSVPGDADYSPLWAVHVYDRAAFDAVHDAESASNAKLIEPNGPLVNCPIVYVAPKT